MFIYSFSSFALRTCHREGGVKKSGRRFHAWCVYVKVLYTVTMNTQKINYDTFKRLLSNSNIPFTIKTEIVNGASFVLILEK